MAQIRRDRAAGLNTAGFVTGYRGSPLGGYDQQLFAAPQAPRPIQHQIQPGGERRPRGHRDLGLATAQSFARRAARWRGRHLVRQGPGRRSLRRRCFATATPRARRRTAVCALPRRLTTTREVLDRAASVGPCFHLGADAVSLSFQYPRNDRDGAARNRDVALLRLLGRHEGDHRDRRDHSRDRSHRRRCGLSSFPPISRCRRVGSTCAGPTTATIRIGRLQDYKGFAAVALCPRANKVNRVTMDSPNARFGIMASGKSYEDIRQALRELGITPEVAAKSVCGSTRSAMPWPLEPQGVREFAVGLERKSSSSKSAARSSKSSQAGAFHWRDDVRPRIVGKMDDHDKRFPSFRRGTSASLRSRARSPNGCCGSISIPKSPAMLRAKADWFNGRLASQMQAVAPIARTPVFLLGLSAQHLDQGARWQPGVRGHWLPLHGVVDGPQHRNTSPIWAARVCRGSVSRRSRTRSNVFANIGDGTYFHSGSLAIRQAVGLRRQHHLQNPLQRRDRDDRRPACRWRACRRSRSPSSFHSEGIREIYLVSENPDAYPASEDRARHQDRASRPARRGHEDVARGEGRFRNRLRADLRRRKSPPPQTRHTGRSATPRDHQSGGCAKAAAIVRCNRTCISVEPLETEFGRKRTINHRAATRTIPA